MKRILATLFLGLFVLGLPFGSEETRPQDTDVLVDLGANGFDMEFDEARQLLYVTVPTLNEGVFISTVTFSDVRCRVRAST